MEEEFCYACLIVTFEPQIMAVGTVNVNRSLSAFHKDAKPPV